MPQYSLPEIFPGLIQRSSITKKKPFPLQLKLVELTLNTPCNVQHTANNNSLKKVHIILKKFLLLLGTHNSQSNASIIYLCLLMTAIAAPANTWTPQIELYMYIPRGEVYLLASKSEANQRTNILFLCRPTDRKLVYFWGFWKLFSLQSNDDLLV